MLIFGYQVARMPAGSRRAVITVGGAMQTVHCAPVSQRQSMTAAMSLQPSPPAWAWPGGQRCERRRPSKHLLLEAGCSGGDRRPAFHDLVVQKCVLTAGLGEGNN